MKKHLLLIILIFLIFGCKKKEVIYFENNNNLYGTWVVYQVIPNIGNVEVQANELSKDGGSIPNSDFVSDTASSTSSVAKDELTRLLIFLFEDILNTNVFSKFEISPQNIMVFDKNNNIVEESSIMNILRISKDQYKIIFDFDEDRYALAELKNGHLIIKSGLITFYLRREE
jgi:hypothetical protein